MKTTLSSIATRIFGQEKTVSGQSETISNYQADSMLVIPQKDRGGAWTRFLVTQAGGYDPQYYTRQEAKSSTVLAAAKFVSVVVHKKLALPGDHRNPSDLPNYVADAQTKLGSIFQVTVSYTTGDAQQVIVPEARENMTYTEKTPIKDFFKWLGRTGFTL